MKTDDYKKDIEGYAEVQKEIEICRKYGIDYTIEKGKIAQIINRLHPPKLRLKVSEIRKETPSTTTFRLVSQDNYLPPFQAGQYISLSVEIGRVRTSRPYSISSPPNQLGFYDITVRRLENGFVSNYLLDEVNVGDIFETSSPLGYFYYNPLFHGNDLVFLAGGSGITPFMSMIRKVTDCGLKRRIHLIYGSQFLDDVIFHEELTYREKYHDNFTYTLVISNPPQGYKGSTGFITADLIRDTVDDITSKTFYICGPEEMYDFCLPELEKLEIPKRRIREELIGPPKDVLSDPGWPKDVTPDAEFSVRVTGGKTITARATEPLISSLEREGIVIPAFCRSGACSSCRVKLLSGKVFQPKGVWLRKSDRQFGYIHACLAYPLKDLEIMI
jgi:ferredoxin-NADP reductase